VVVGALLGDMTAFAADHHGDLALIVQLHRHVGTHQRLAGAHERARMAIEHAGIFRRVGVVEIGIAVGIVDADAEDFSGASRGGNRLDGGERKVGPHAGNAARTSSITSARMRSTERREARAEPHVIHHPPQPPLEARSPVAI